MMAAVGAFGYGGGGGSNTASPRSQALLTLLALLTVSSEEDDDPPPFSSSWLQGAHRFCARCRRIVDCGAIPNSSRGSHRRLVMLQLRTEAAEGGKKKVGALLEGMAMQGLLLLPDKGAGEGGGLLRQMQVGATMAIARSRAYTQEDVHGFMHAYAYAYTRTSSLPSHTSTSTYHTRIHAQVTPSFLSALTRLTFLATGAWSTQEPPLDTLRCVAACMHT